MSLIFDEFADREVGSAADWWSTILERNPNLRAEWANRQLATDILQETGELPTTEEVMAQVIEEGEDPLFARETALEVLDAELEALPEETRALAAAFEAAAAGEAVEVGVGVEGNRVAIQATVKLIADIIATASAAAATRDGATREPEDLHDVVDGLPPAKHPMEEVHPAPSPETVVHHLGPLIRGAVHKSRDVYGGGSGFTPLRDIPSFVMDALTEYNY